MLISLGIKPGAWVRRLLLSLWDRGQPYPALHLFVPPLLTVLPSFLVPERGIWSHPCSNGCRPQVMWENRNNHLKASFSWSFPSGIMRIAWRFAVRQFLFSWDRHCDWRAVEHEGKLRVQDMDLTYMVLQGRQKNSSYQLSSLWWIRRRRETFTKIIGG